MAGQNDLVYKTIPYQLTMAPGTTAVIIQEAGRLASEFKLISGGTLYYLGSSGTPGFTLGYLLGTNEALSVNGAAGFYLGALSATCIIHGVHGYSQGS